MALAGVGPRTMTNYRSVPYHGGYYSRDYGYRTGCNDCCLGSTGGLGCW